MVTIWRKGGQVEKGEGLVLFFFLLFRAIPTTYGGSQARGPIRAIVPSLRHSYDIARSEPHLQPTPQLRATPEP